MAKQHSISRSDANAEISKFISIKAEILDKVNIDSLSSEARQYVSSSLLSFIFYKDQLDTLFNTVSANAYRVYMAADSYGQPTLVVVPCELGSDEVYASNKLSTSQDPGQQYPVFKSTGFTIGNFDIGGE